MNEPKLDILEDRWLHKVFLFFSSLDDLPQAAQVIGLVLIPVITYLVWGIFAPQTAWLGSGLLLLFILSDILLLHFLPKKGVSFGNVASQFAVMLMPRLGVTGAAMLLSLWQDIAGIWVMIILQLAGTVVYFWATWVEPHQLNLTTLDLDSAHLPATAPPIRMLHLSDIHLERLTRREARLLTLIQEANPDLIVITGDYLNLSYTRDPESIGQVRSLLSKIQAPHGVYATLGSPPVDVRDIAPHHFDDSHIQLLRHDTLTLDLGEGRHLTLLGMDCTHDMDHDSQKLEALFAVQNGRHKTILLYHSPELMPHALQHEIDLFLCGHTHGGQVRIPFYGAVITSACTGKQYEMGRYDENGTTLYVSRGIGLEGLCAPRIRLFCPPEITLVRLQGVGE